MRTLQFPKLFEPGYIGKLKVRNRIIMAPIAACFEDSDGTFSQRAIDYFVTRAKGGVGLIMTGASRVDRIIEDPPTWPVPWIDSDMHIAKASDLVEAVHDYGAKICIQLSAGVGRQADWASPTRPPVAPSEIPAYADPNVTCHELTKEEIGRIVNAHAEAARRVMVAGFDMIEFHAHTGYLTDEFMTEAWNKRKDEYGGDIEKRMRFPLELIASVRNVVGEDFPLSFRLTIDHKMSDGRSLSESLEIAKRLEAAGIDILHVDGGCYESVPWIFPPIYFPEGCMVDLSLAIKNVVEIPVITVGKIKRPEFAEQILNDGKADFICMGRQLLADPDWANKAKDGDVKDIRPCINCNEFCIGRMFLYRPISCSVNPQVGKERYYAITHAEQSKKIIVVGGGPAGMEAARVAAMRRHKVTLYEKEKNLGGQLKVAAMPPFKGVLMDFINYLSSQLDKLGVQIKTGQELTPEHITKLGPDAVIIASGANPVIPDIPGIKNPNVITATDLLLGRKTPGEIVLVAGGGMAGCDTALFLALEGKDVTIIEMLPDVATDINPMSRAALLDMLDQNGVTIHTGKTIRKITMEGVILCNEKGREENLKGDTIVLAFGARSENKYVESIKDNVKEVYIVGDCSSPRKVGEAIHEGFVAGWRV